ncbi:hypothetical protein [Paenibacillus sp. A14]|uniref:hypothetical protein n=1 Tax=Paenibacillus sp. A14 TaxID=3119820 RepID=UPI002FE339C2
MSNSLKFANETVVTESYWDELLVNHERIAETFSETDKTLFIACLSPQDKEGLQLILNLPNFEDQEKWTQYLKAVPEFIHFLFLKEFLKRKKKAVEEVFDHKVSDYGISSVSPLIKLIHLFYTNPSWLLEILVMHEWKNKASGDVFTANKFPETWRRLNKEETYKTKLVETLHRSSRQGNDYRIVAHCDDGEKRSIYLVYKMVKDTKKPGYDQNKRIKDRDQIMFAVNADNFTVEIKAPNSDSLGIRNYLSEQFNITLQKTENKLFTGYEVNDVLRLFQEGKPVGDEEPEDFLIDYISFSNSLLIKSPDVILQHKGNDIWPSVIDAFQRRIIDIYSLKDIRKIAFRSEKHSKSIRTIVLEDGSVIFKLNDGNLSEATKTSIKEKFFKKFGFPLDQPVKNKFNGGIAQKVDQIFRFSRIDQLSQEHLDLLSELRTSELITVNEEISYHCSYCSFATGERSLLKEDANKKLICPECDESIIESVEEELSPHKENIEQFIYQLIDNFIENHEHCESQNLSKQKFKNIKYTFKRFLFNKQPYQILVTDRVLSKRTLEWVERKLIPTIIICYGIDKQTSERYALDTIEQITFGDIYISLESQMFNDMLSNYLKELEKRSYHLVVNAAMKATKNLNFIGDKTIELKYIYDEHMLEDDVFTVIKHLFPNSEKWGKEYTGETVPEGIFAIQYKESNGSMAPEIKHGFTYDCKFTMDKSGYKLGSSENRKGLHYVNKLNRLVDISYYCTFKEITSHIFIGNKFKERQVRAMANFFREEITKGHNTKPVFINTKDLAYLYDQVIHNKEKIEKVLDVYYKQMVSIFTTDEIIITKEYIDEQLEDIDIAAKSYSTLDTSTLTRRLLGRKK